MIPQNELVAVCGVAFGGEANEIGERVGVRHIHAAKALEQRHIAVFDHKALTFIVCTDIVPPDFGAAGLEYKMNVFGKRGICHFQKVVGRGAVLTL